jgi:hypothetical protein
VENKFQIGDKVYLNQIFDHGLLNAKHSKIFTGPYIILDLVNSSLAKLQHFNTGKILKNWVNIAHLRPSRDERRARFLDKMNKNKSAENGDENNLTPVAPSLNVIDIQRNTNEKAKELSNKTALLGHTGQTAELNDQRMQEKHTEASQFTSSFSIQLQPHTQDKQEVLAQDRAYLGMRPVQLVVIQGQCNKTSSGLSTQLVNTDASKAASIKHQPVELGLQATSQPVEAYTTQHQSLSITDRQTKAARTDCTQIQATASQQNLTALPRPYSSVTESVVKIVASKSVKGEKFGKIKFHDKNIQPVWRKWIEIPNKLRVEYYIDRFNKRKAKTVRRK